MTRALSIYTRIAYLDQSGGMGGTFASVDDDATGEEEEIAVDFVEFEESSEEGLLGALLYREWCRRLFRFIAKFLTQLP